MAFRICSECNCVMIQGFMIEDGLSYFCKKKCLEKNMTWDEYMNLYDDGNGDSYYTDWHEMGFEEDDLEELEEFVLKAIENENWKHLEQIVDAINRHTEKDAKQAFEHLYKQFDMINFVTDIGVEVALTVDDFITETKDMIDFAINDKEYELDSLSVDFVAEDITGRVGNHGMGYDGLFLIHIVLSEYEKKGGIVL